MTRAPLDQTRGETMPFFQDGQTAQLSCNEVASLCMKAARGAGMSWGMAEEAGFAASWLVSHGIDGPTHLCAHLKRADGRDWADLCPTITPGTWQNSKGNPLCPIILGATLCDYAALPEGPVAGCRIALGPVAAPILLVPFLTHIAETRDLVLDLTWPGGTLVIDPDKDCLATAEPSLSDAAEPLTLAVRTAAPHRSGTVTRPNAHTTAQTIAALNTFAMRTTVPATEASRAGAGSALSDND
ncbi:DUF3726 domain-containing protein [Marivita sp. S0852]|uniref:DUF3726 domain-containing protein n=1 Tax=Marivita sp. S0852 TaxID=3373893 RepID=UPI003982AA89